jgi:hypothetical protein
MRRITSLRAACGLAALAALGAALSAAGAKESNFFRLSLRPGATERAEICGRQERVSRIARKHSAVAKITLPGIALPQHTPFVIAIRQCRGGYFTTIRRLRVELPPLRHAVARQLRGLGVGEYRIEALLNGDRPPTASALRHLIVTRSSAGGAAREPPRACRRSEVATLVRAFVRSFNAGNRRTLDRLVAREPEFHWYSTGAPGARLGRAAEDRTSLPAYFAMRHAQGEQLHLSRLKVNGNSRPPRDIPPYGNFEYDLTRQADDLEPTPYSGKGAAYCYKRRADSIIVSSMGPLHG